MENIIPTMVRLPEDLKLRVDEVAFNRKKLKMKNHKINNVLVEAILLGLQILEEQKNDIIKNDYTRI